MIPVAIGLIEGFRAFGWLTEDVLDIYPVQIASHWGHSALRASESAQPLPTYRRLACDPPLVRPGSSFLFRELTSVIT